MKGSCLIQGAPIWAASFPWRHACLSPVPSACSSAAFGHRVQRGDVFAVWTAPGSFPCRPTTWLRVATSPQVGVPCIPVEGGGHRLAFPHSKAGPWQSGLPLAVRGPLAVVGEPVSNPLSSHPFQKVLASAHTLARSTGRLSQVLFPFSSMLCGLLRLASSIKFWVWTLCLLRCPRNQRMKTQWTTQVSRPWRPGPQAGRRLRLLAEHRRDSQLFLSWSLPSVQIPPSTTYAITPMKRPMEEDGEEKSPSKKKKKIQKKGTSIGF